MEETKRVDPEQREETCCEEQPEIVEEIQVEELAIDGICGVY